jgi:hypothetical protein
MGVLRFAQDKLLTSNCVLGMSILYLGENQVHPLDGVDNNLSIKSIISILSTLFATQLHQESAKQADRFGLRPRRGQTGLSTLVVSAANIPSTGLAA